MTKIREALSSKKYNLINSGAYAALSCKGLAIYFCLGFSWSLAVLFPFATKHFLYTAE